MRRPSCAGGRGAMRSGVGGGYLGPLILCRFSPKLGMDIQGGQAHRIQILPRPGTSAQTDSPVRRKTTSDLRAVPLGGHRETPAQPRTVTATRNEAKAPTVSTVTSPTVRASLPLAATPNRDRRLAR